MSHAEALRRIARTISCPPVIGHWPHMRADQDARILRAIANELEELETVLHSLENLEQHRLHLVEHRDE